MPFPIDELRRRLTDAFPDARLDVEDLTGGADHYSVKIVSAAFDKKLPLERHRMVYTALGEAMNGDIHALALVTRTFSEVNPGGLS